MAYKFRINHNPDFKKRPSYNNTPNPNSELGHEIDPWKLLKGYQETYTNGWEVYCSGKGDAVFTLKTARGKPIYQSYAPFNPGPDLRRNAEKYPKANERYLERTVPGSRDLFPQYYDMLTIFQDYKDMSHQPALIFSKDGKLLFDENVFLDAFEFEFVNSVRPLKNANGVYLMEYVKSTGGAFGLLDSKFQSFAMNLSYSLWLELGPLHESTGQRCYIFHSYDQDDHTRFECETYGAMTDIDIKKLFAETAPELQEKFLVVMKQYKMQHCREGY